MNNSFKEIEMKFKAAIDTVTVERGLSNLELFIYKILLGFIMTYISFGYQNIKYVYSQVTGMIQLFIIACNILS